MHSHPLLGQSDANVHCIVQKPAPAVMMHLPPSHSSPLEQSWPRPFLAGVVGVDGLGEGAPLQFSAVLGESDISPGSPGSTGVVGGASPRLGASPLEPLEPLLDDDGQRDPDALVDPDDSEELHANDDVASAVTRMKSFGSCMGKDPL